ncbi:hypothetical protein ACGTJS_00115 [Faucicola mancuniensis]|uniref:hypothetical protein n=1 Tax=Faucicola mancuniensis TaxID=1309795 RepID=UPI003977CC06
MSKFNIIFLDIPYNIHEPNKDIFEKYFKNYRHSDWENGASFVFIDDSGIKYTLAVSEDIEYGFNLIYGSPNVNCYSLGEKDLLNNFFENSDEMIMPKGTYVSNEQAWLAVQDFLDNPLIPSPRIEWVTDDKIDWEQIQL